MTPRNIQQQNAERRLSHARWEHETTSPSEGKFLFYGILAALLFVWVIS